MPVFIAAGMLFLIFSVLFLFAPGVLVKLSEIGNKLIFADYNSMAYRKISGVILLLMSALMFYLGLNL